MSPNATMWLTDVFVIIIFGQQLRSVVISGYGGTGNTSESDQFTVNSSFAQDLQATRRNKILPVVSFNCNNIKQAKQFGVFRVCDTKFFKAGRHQWISIYHRLLPSHCQDGD